MAGFRNFMAGRYGTDKLGLTLLGAALVMSLLSSFIPLIVVRLALTLAYYGLMFWALFRMFSRNTYARYEENRKFLRFFDQLKDRDHRYFSCPKCRQTVRVPRGKGKIAITCPKCRERFIKKT
ncbi:MAG: hypothetical protein IKY17_07500 [Oscillospiraceae bacterium]|nr:hypothetical protein [Oscillospiraceae bacterium]